VPSTDTDIRGYYAWNGDGFRGDLNIVGEQNGIVEAILSDNGLTEYIGGNWYQGDNELTLTRPLTNGTTQSYYYFLGGGPYSSYPKMFGGFYTTTATGDLERGSYLDSAYTF
jgi:hypothetical protein